MVLEKGFLVILNKDVSAKTRIFSSCYELTDSKDGLANKNEGFVIQY